MQNRNIKTKVGVAAQKKSRTTSGSHVDLAALEARVTALEQVVRETATASSESARSMSLIARTDELAPPTEGDDRFWALNELTRQQKSAPENKGAVLYVGNVNLPSGAHYVWQRQDSTRELLEQDWRNLSDMIAALAHPMRLEILKHALGQERSTQDFMALPEMGTTGQLFHHIKALQDAGWLRSLQRGFYGVPGERIVPLLAILAAARG